MSSHKPLTSLARSFRRRTAFLLLLISAEWLVLYGIKCLISRNAAPSSLPSPSYHVTDLGMPSGCHGVYPVSLGPNGAIVGRLEVDLSGPRAFVWQRGQFTILAPDDMSIAYGSNKKGAVVGISITPDQYAPIIEAVLWYKGKERSLFDDTAGSVAVAIDERGDIYGKHAYANTSRWRIFRQDSNGKTTYLDEDSATDSSFVHAINHRGDMAIGLVSHTKSPAYAQAAVYQQGKIYPLPAPDDSSAALGINDAGEVAGYILKNGRTHPALWRNRRLAPLPIPDDLWGSARAINSRGDIVGAFLAGTTGKAFLIHDGKLLELSSLVDSSVPLEAAIAIDDAGNIVATGKEGAAMHTYLLTPL